MDKKNVVGLNKSYKKKVNVDNYDNLYVGFEFEFAIDMDNNTSPSSTRLMALGDDGPEEVPYNSGGGTNDKKMEEIAKHFGVERGKNNGRGNKKHKIELSNGQNFEVPVNCDLYNEENLVCQVYNDGSTPFEVVTRPVNMKMFGDVKTEVFEWLKGEGADMWVGGRAGLHMTFLLDHHMERSKWDEVVVQNMMQYLRCYYQELVELGRCNDVSRKTEYRRLMSLDSVQECSNTHHNAIATRKRDGRIWGIEVRMPDGCNDWDEIVRTCKFWMAFIRHCANISKYGRITFDQCIWDTQKRFYENHHSTDIEAQSCDRLTQLAKQMKESLNFYGVDIREGKVCDFVQDGEGEELLEEVWVRVLEGDKKLDIVKELRGKGFDNAKIVNACREVGVK